MNTQAGQLTLLCEQWEDARSRGVVVTPEELCREHPEFLDQVRRAIHNLQVADRAAESHLGSRHTHSALVGDGSRHEPTESNTGAYEEAPEPAADVVAALLAPPRGPGELGRLGPYRVLGILGRGGMGVVLRAEDTALRRDVALKVMLSHVAANPAARARFLREARSQAKVEHDHVATIFQVGEDRGVPYLTMPLLKGLTLSAALKASPRPPAGEILRIGRETAEGLAAAHGHGLVHRDVKPGNVWLEGSKRRVKILDFGLARISEGDRDHSDPEPITKQGATLGTPAYMSPEQAGGQVVDHRTDLFSLGVVLYQMATGDLPFKGPNMMAVLMALAVHHPPPPRALNPELPAALDDLIQRLLAKDPAGRPTTAEAVAEQLRQIEESCSRATAVAPPAPNDPWADIVEAESGQVLVPHLPSSLTASASHRRMQKPNARSRPRRKALVLAAIGVLAALLGGLTWQAIRIATPKGTLVVDSEDPNVEVVVKKDGAVLADRTRNREIALRVGDDYTIELAEPKGGLKLSTTKFTIHDGKREVVKVWVEKPKDALAKKPDGKRPQSSPAPAHERDRKAAETLLPVVKSLTLRLESGGEATVTPGDALPAMPFSLVAIDLPSNASSRRGLISNILLPAIEDLSSLEKIGAVVYRGLPWSGKDLNRLAALPAAKTLLSLGGNFALTQGGLKTLKEFPNLTSLSCDAQNADDALLERLGEFPRITELCLTNLGQKMLPTNGGLIGITKLPLKSLKFVRSVPPLDAQIGRHFAYMSTLRILHLNLMNLEADVLSEIGKCTQLSSLKIQHAGLTDASLDHLKGLTSLKALDVNYNEVTDGAAKKLSEALPQCWIIWGKNKQIAPKAGGAAPPKEDPDDS